MISLLLFLIIHIPTSIFWIQIQLHFINILTISSIHSMSALTVVQLWLFLECWISFRIRMRFRWKLMMKLWFIIIYLLFEGLNWLFIVMLKISRTWINFLELNIKAWTGVISLKVPGCSFNAILSIGSCSIIDILECLRFSYRFLYLILGRMIFNLFFLFSSIWLLAFSFL